MSELTKDQLLEYVKKQKLKIKKLETEVAKLSSKSNEDIKAVSNTDESLRLQELESIVSQKNKELESQANEFSSKIKKIEENLVDQINLNKSLEAKSASLELEIKNLLKQEESGKDQIFNLQKEKDRIQIHLDECLKKIEQNKTESLKIISEKDDEISRLSSRSDQMDAIEKSLVEAKDVIEDLKSKNLEQSEVLKSKLVELQQVTDSKEKLERELHLSQSKLSEVEGKFQKISHEEDSDAKVSNKKKKQKKKDKVVEKNDILDSNEKLEFISKISHLESEQSNLALENKNLIQELEDLRNSYESELKGLNKSIESLSTTKSDQENQIHELSVKNSELNKLIIEAEKTKLSELESLKDNLGLEIKKSTEYNQSKAELEQKILQLEAMNQTSQERINEILQEKEALVSQISEINDKSSQKREEGASQAEQYKKLAGSLKLKVKKLSSEKEQLESILKQRDGQLDDLKTQLENKEASMIQERNELVKQSAILDSEKKRELVRLDEMEVRLTTLLTEKQELIEKMELLNKSRMSNEEKISNLLSEKNSLHEELMQTRQELSMAQNEERILKANFDEMNQLSIKYQSQIKELEEKVRMNDKLIVDNSQGFTVKEEELRRKIEGMTEDLIHQKKQIDELNSIITDFTSENKKLNRKLVEQKGQLASKEEDQLTWEEKVSEMNQEIQRLNEEVKKSETQMRSRNLKISLFEYKFGKPEEFSVLYRLSLPKLESEDEKETWCFVLETKKKSLRGKFTPKISCHRESDIQSWLEKGALMKGTWPEFLDAKWDLELKSCKHSLEKERDDFKSKYEDISSQFQSYKIRAQAALKKIGNDERVEKQKAMELENKEFERLNEIIGSLEESLEQSRSEFDQLVLEKENVLKEKQYLWEENQNFSDKIKSLEEEIEDREFKIRSFENQITNIINEKDAITEKLIVSEHALEKMKRSKVNSQQNDLNSLINESLDPLDHCDDKITSFTPNSKQDNNSKLHEVVIDTKELQKESNTSVTPNSLDSSNPPLSSSSFHELPSPNRQLTSEDDIHESFEQSKLLLFQQAEEKLKLSVLSLRQENAQLNLEINDLKNEIVLREDQFSALKNAIRELEASLKREKEFNAENRRINADYLVNVMRKFLMTTDASERSKLVQVICTILQFSPSEIKVITEKWAVNAGGIVGWLLPRGNSNHIKSKGEETDITYDPQTGKGIDINFY